MNRHGDTFATAGVMYCAPHSAILLGTDLTVDFYMILIRCACTFPGQIYRYLEYIKLGTRACGHAAACSLLPRYAAALLDHTRYPWSPAT